MTFKSHSYQETLFTFSGDFRNKISPFQLFMVSLSKAMVPSRITYPSPSFTEHWKQQAGVTMLSKLDGLPSKKEIDDFNSLYQKCDVLGDRVILEVFEKLGHKKGQHLLHEVLEKPYQPLRDVPPLLQQLITESEALPEWYNKDLLEAGSAFCRRSGPFGLLVLRNYSLMGGYESSAINKPLIFTGALKSGPAKRLSETLSFWVDVTGENALMPGAPGFKSAVNVRIIHALARVYTRKSPAWRDDQWGIPLNHGDMVATYLGFSLVFLEGLKMQGFHPSELEVEGLFHLWKYIGYLLGIPADYLPDTEKEAIALLYKWSMTQPSGDQDTISLAVSLMNAPLYASYPKKKWQKRLLVKIYLGFNQFFLGRDSCQRMGLPNTVFRFLPYISAFINRLHEMKVWYSHAHYEKAVISGRRQQEEIREEFNKTGV